MYTEVVTQIHSMGAVETILGSALIPCEAVCRPTWNSHYEEQHWHLTLSMCFYPFLTGSQIVQKSQIKITKESNTHRDKDTKNQRVKKESTCK